MLTEASQDETLARRDKAAAAADRRNPVRSTRRDLHLPPPARQAFYGERQQSDRGSRPRGRRGFGDSRGGRGRGNPNPRRYDLPPQLITRPVSGNFASILGNFTWAIPTIPFAQSHYRSMQQFYISESKKLGGDLSIKCSLSLGARSDLEWWIHNLNEMNGKDFFPKSPDIKIFSDASLSGWGAVCNGVTTRGPWTTTQAKLHINSLELTGALYALQSFAGSTRGLSIRIYLDNTTAVCYFCEERKLSVEAVHLPGAMNEEADKESRSGSDASDWLLNRSVFSNLNAIWPVDIDLFSSHWNALASATMVSCPPGTNLRRSDTPPRIPGSLGFSNRSCSPALANRIVAVSRMEVIRRDFRREGFSEPLVNLLVAGNRSSTLSTYESAWRNWIDWCFRRNENPLSVHQKSVLEFLTRLH
ncbi:reverse transcriptase [Daphnia sinensis]|uniref:Reverse transcriptase n=1 Tax=Daphnia sinensis TaxID=1820382 RepID=A0AAD5KH78_9CRUS|nr:reverse transcriptase [Daphnia sinensis]